MFDGSQSLAVSPENRISVSVKNLGVTVPSKDKESGPVPILQSVSFDLQPSNMMAIMGGSGSGKTTLLNVLAQRTNIASSGLKFSGEICYSYPTSPTSSRMSTAYMVQEDTFLPGLTLQETLEYQAELRLGSVSKTDQLSLIATLLDLLELDHRKDEIVVSFTGAINLSGGEQRRTSLAIQLLSKPQILFLDEPTTGLDTSSALKMVSVLKKLASPEIGITVILSIHQPRSEVASLFDQICVLSRGGRLVYYGSLGASVDYFAGIENMEVESKNDSFAILNKILAMSVKDTTSAEKEVESSRITDYLVKEWSDSHRVESSLSPEEEKAGFQKNMKMFKPLNPLPLHRELYVLIRRTMLISVRDRLSLYSINGGAAVLGVVLGWIFFKPDPNLSGIRSLTSCLYAMLEIIGFAPLTMELSRLWQHDGVFFFKEYRERCVSIPGFLISRRIAKLFLEDVPMSLIFATITYFMWGLRVGQTSSDSGDGSYFGIFFTVSLLVGVSSMSLATLCFALASGFPTSIVLINLIYQVQNSGCGYFVNAATMPVYVRWVKYIAFFWYAFGALCANQYTDWVGNCPFEAGSPQCVEYTGNYQLEVLGFPQNWIGAPIGYLVLWLVGFNVLAMVGLRFRNYDVEMAKKKKNKLKVKSRDTLSPGIRSSSSSASEDKEGRDEMRTNINVRDVSLTVKVKENQNLFSRKIVTRTLLDIVSANFMFNSINVIMGPSGGGKTTMLNFLASRLARSLFSRNGKIFLNGTQEISPSDLGKISAYVTQTDNLLMPELTVRETLYFQARLRIPAVEHDNIPFYIESILRSTGLVDCADTPVGNSATKGISGGEKRRVSIAIQLLGRPKILFLDEPTSGLDSATSLSILGLLKELASSGTTIITTIHQPSKEIFGLFDCLVLLARGGSVVYDGPIKRLNNYLSSIGHGCPEAGNLADHILDILSRQFDETKDDLNGRVAYLKQHWSQQALLHDPEIVGGRNMNLDSYKNEGVPWPIALKSVCTRQFIVSFRATDILVARVWTVVILALIYSVFYATLKSTPEGISDRLGLFQSVANLFFCGLINNLALYPSQRNLFHQEYRDGTYGVLIFAGAYLFTELPFELLPSAFFSAMVVFVIKLPRTAKMYFAVLFCSFVGQNCGDSAGIFFNSVFSHMGLVTNLLSNLFMIGIFMAGTMSLQMPKFFQAWNYLNPTKYMVQILTNMSMENQKFSCLAETCTLSSGEAVLEMYGLSADMKSAFGGLVACFVAYRVISTGASWVRVKWFI